MIEPPIVGRVSESLIEALIDERDGKDLAVEIVKYLQANFFRNDNRKMKIETKEDALIWLNSQK
jgi:hypothetical protein